jgi:hypothetical protein
MKIMIMKRIRSTESGLRSQSFFEWWAEPTLSTRSSWPLLGSSFFLQFFPALCLRLRVGSIRAFLGATTGQASDQNNDHAPPREESPQAHRRSWSKEN